MNKNKHLLLWSSVGVLALLVTAAVQENVFKQWRQIQAASKNDAGPLDVHLRQVVVLGLKATDRCVSCHVGMAPGEQGIAGPPAAAAHKPVGHDPAEFGCTTCHGGQGRATDKDDAHGDVPFWPEPMLPKAYAFAGCGACHTHLSVPNEAELNAGRSLVERYDCLACHRLDGRGGTIRPGGGVLDGPDLSRVGASGYDRQWYEKHLKKAQTAASGSPWSTSFGPIEEPQRARIEVFLASRVGAPGLVEAKAMFHSLGCRGCHKVGGVGGDDGPDLTQEGSKDPGRIDFTHVPGKPTFANWLAEHFRDPAGVVPGSQMPRMGLSDQQVDLLTFYMLSLRQSGFPEAYWPKDRIRAVRFGEREFATDGATLYGTFCAACHGEQGQGRRYLGMTPFPAVGNADFLAAASDDFLVATVQHGRPGRRMPAWGEKEGGLRLEEIRSVVAHLRRLGNTPAPEPESKRRWVEADPSAGKDLYARYCAGCHGANGQGVAGPALNNKALLTAASDTYFVQTITRGRRDTDMQAFASPSSVHPALSPAEIESIVAYIRTWEVP